MSVFSSDDNAKAFKPVIQAAVIQAMQALTEDTAPALGRALRDALDGMTITITIARKP